MTVALGHVEVEIDEKINLMIKFFFLSSQKVEKSQWKNLTENDIAKELQLFVMRSNKVTKILLLYCH